MPTFTIHRLRIDPVPAPDLATTPAAPIDPAVLPLISGTTVGPGDLLAQAVHLPGGGGLRTPGHRFRPGRNTLVDAEGSIRATAYGLASLGADDLLHVDEPLVVSGDRMEAYLYRARCDSGFFPDADCVRELLVKNNISRISLPVPFPESPGWILVARGEAPVHGSSRRTRFFREELNENGKKPLDRARIDHRERGFVKQIRRGEPIFEQLPPEAPRDGVDVFGQKIQGEMENFPGFQPGANLEIDSGRPAVWVATIDGCLSVQHDTVDVLELLSIEGDVDLNTGNIRYHGSVRVAGGIRPGMIVNAGGDIMVGGEIEQAELRCGGSLYVAGGIIGKGKRKITAGHMVVAAFIQNSNVYAGGDVLVSRYIVNSMIFSGDSIQVGPDPGRIISGIVVAGHGIEAVEAGNSSASFTILRAGLGNELHERLEAARAKTDELDHKKQALIGRITRTAGVPDLSRLKAAYGALDETLRAKISVDLAELRDLNLDLKETREEINRYEQMLKSKLRPYVKISEKILEGVRIVIQNREFPITGEEPGRTFIAPAGE